MLQGAFHDIRSTGYCRNAANAGDERLQHDCFGFGQRLVDGYNWMTTPPRLSLRPMIVLVATKNLQ